MTFLDPTYQIRNNPNQMVAEFDPFQDTSGMYARKNAVCRITLGSFDINTAYDATAAFSQHLISVHITDSLGNMEAQIELDDRYGSLPIPPLQAPCMILLGWLHMEGEICFWGNITDIEHGCSRTQSPGRRLFITATGENFYSPGKEPQQDSIGEGAQPGQNEGEPIPFPEAIMRFAKAAGHTAIIHPALSKITRDHWSIDQESFLNWSSKVSNELGLNFRVIKGTQAEFTIPSERADQQVRMLQAIWGQNLIGWRVHPAAARPAWNEVKQQYFDTRKALWKGLSSMIGNAGSSAGAAASYAPAGPSAGGGMATDQAIGTSGYINNAVKVGRVVVIGDPTAHAGFYVNLVGCRPGVDGIWHTESIEHLFSRQGYVTWYNVTYNQAPNDVIKQIIQNQRDTDPNAPVPDYNAIIAQTNAAFTVDPAYTATMLKGIPLSNWQEGLMAQVFGIKPNTLSDAQLQALMTQIAQAQPGAVLSPTPGSMAATTPLTASQIQAAKNYLGR